MATLEALPSELISHIIRCLAAKRDVANVRLVSRRLNLIAYEVLFETVSLYPQWSTDENEDAHPATGYDATVFKNILEHATLRQLVKKVILYTVEPNCDYNWYIAGRTLDQGPSGCWYEAPWLECMGRLNEFPYVKSVTLHFDRYASLEFEEEEVGGLNVQGGVEKLKFINQILRHFDGRLTGLALRHYENGTHKLQDCHGGSNEDLQLLWRNLKTLTTFRISVVHLEVCEEFGTNRRLGKPHAFWSEFPTLCLQPMQQNLKRLVLYSDMRIGCFPKADFRSVHFPRLESLTLGFFTFCKDWQFDWITAHGNTLKELYLDHCSILRQLGYLIKNWLDEDGFPKHEYLECRGQADFDQYDRFFLSDPGIYLTPSYETRWHNVFIRFAEEIKNLRIFKFGISEQWNFDTRSLCFADCAESLPVIPWEVEQDIQNKMNREAYLIYIDWEEIYETDWELWDFDLDSLDPGTRALMDPPPQCQEEDEMALQLLLRHIKGHR